MVNTDFNLYYTIAIGKRVKCKLTSMSICTEVTGHFKGRRKGGEQGLSRVREVTNYRGVVSVNVDRPVVMVS